MDRINYAGDSILTGTAIAHALLDYAQALAEVGASATVEIPSLGNDGTVVRTEVLVGPASQLAATTIDADAAEIVDDVLVARLEGTAQRLRREGSFSPRAGVDETQPDHNWSEFDF